MNSILPEFSIVFLFNVLKMLYKSEKDLINSNQYGEIDIWSSHK